MATADQPDDGLPAGYDPVVDDLRGLTDALDTKYRTRECVRDDEFTTGDAHRYLRQQYAEAEEQFSPAGTAVVEADTMAAERLLRDALRDGVDAGVLDRRLVTISYNTEHEARPLLYRFRD